MIAADINFDNSLDTFVVALSTLFSPVKIEHGVFIRDAVGRLSFVSTDEAPPEGLRNERDAVVRQQLGQYARKERVLIYKNDFGADLLLNEPDKLTVKCEDLFCRLIDRRIVGAGWLQKPVSEIAQPARIVFASLKGGVGRSTAIAVAAADLARRNRNVLVVDLDLEAPGLGPILLNGSRLPPYGVVDFLVENGVQKISDDLLPSFIGTSSLTSAGGGRVDVVPAFGLWSWPENVLPKLARALVDDVDDEGKTRTVAQQISEMIDKLSLANSYDVVLIDSRAGLAELAAPAVLGLGASVLLFGTAQEQTIRGYQALFAALNLLATRDRANGEAAEWRASLKAVYAKASFDERLTASHIDNLYDLFSSYLYDAEDGGNLAEGIAYDIDDTAAPHFPLTIPFNPAFLDFDPTKMPTQLSQSFYEQTFRPFMDGLDLMIDEAGE